MRSGTSPAAAASRHAWTLTWTTRLLVWAAGVGAVAGFGLSDRAARFDPAGVTTPFGPPWDDLLAPAARWDAVWFVTIAESGYDGARAAFFPLYPVLAAVAGAPLGSPLLGGLVVSLGCLVAALAMLERLVAIDFGPHVARTCVALVALFPTAFFLSAVYSESLYLALSVGSLLAARRGRWGWAVAAAALASATRSAGVVLLVPLVVLYLRERGRPQRDAALLALVPAGLVAYCAYLGVAIGDPWAPFRAQEVWLREFAGPFGAVPDGAVAAWLGLRQLLSGAREPVLFAAAGGDPFTVARTNLMLFAFLVAALVALAGALRRLPRAYGLYALCALALPLSYPPPPQPLMSLPRFLVVLWPLPLWLALVVAGRPRARRATLVASAILLVVLTGLYSTWHWVA